MEKKRGKIVQDHVQPFLKSFQYAFKGLVRCVQSERNMRIHVVCAVTVVLLSLFFDFSLTQYALLFVAFALVMGFEMVNTAVEALVDFCAPQYDALARVAKDIAAGAVLLSAIFAVVCGVCLFWQPDGFIRLFQWFCRYPYALVGVAAYAVAAVLFIFMGTAPVRRAVRRGTRK